MAEDNLDKTIKVISLVNALIPIASTLTTVVMQQFRDQTPGMTDEQRTALLKAKGIEITDMAEQWLREHGYPVE